MKDFHQKLFKKACKRLGIETKLKMRPQYIIGSGDKFAAKIRKKGEDLNICIPAYPDTLDEWIEVINEYLRITDNIEKGVYHGRKSETPESTAAAPTAATRSDR